MAQKLTEKEIENMLSFIQPQKDIPEETAMSVVHTTKESFRKQLRNQMIYPEIIPALQAEMAKQYRQSLIQPGESVGVICAQSIGEKQTQTSVIGSEKIIVRKGDTIINTTIGEFIDTEMKKGIVVQTDNNGLVKPLKEDTQILTVSHSEKTVWQNITELSRHPPHGGLVRITTQSGRSVTTTLSHSHLQKRGDNIVPVLGSELSIGDRIPVVKRSPIPEINVNQINVSDYIEHDSIKDGIIQCKLSHMKNIIPLDETFGWFLGAYLAEGFCNDYSTSITNVNKEFEQNVKSFIQSVGLTYRTVTNVKELTGGIQVNSKDPHKKYESTSYITSSRPLALLMMALCGTGSSTKKIPSFVFGSNRKFIASIIRGWMDGDGNISATKREIRGFSICRELIEQFSVLFSYFGIYGTLGLQNKSKKLYEYHIYGKEYSRIYLEEIGTDLEYKKTSLELIIDTPDDFSSRLEMIPHDIGRHITTVSKVLGLPEHSRKYARFERKKQNIGRNTLGRFIKIFEDYGSEEADITTEMNYLRQAYNSDIVWDKIVKLENLEESDYKYVYDFSVHGNETFSLQSGIIVHNTLNSVDWTEKLLYVSENTTIVEPIGQMIDRMLSNEDNKENITHIPENRTEYLPLSKGYMIPSCNENGDVNWYRIEAVTRHLPVGKLVKVTTQSGRSVIATQSKSFLVWDGEKFEGKMGSDVKVGDIIPTTNTLRKPDVEQTYFDMESIFPKNEYLYTDEIKKAIKHKAHKKESTLEEWWKNNNCNDFTLPFSSHRSLFNSSNITRRNFYHNCEDGYIYIHNSPRITSDIPDKLKLNSEFGFVVGIWLAEGFLNRNELGFSNNDDNIKNRLIQYFNQYKINYSSRNETRITDITGTSINIRFNSTLFVILFRTLCGNGAKNKKVPSFVYNAPTDFISGLLDGYFSSDGSIRKSDGNIEVTSVSENLLLGISLLLSYYGIFSKISSYQSTKSNTGNNIVRTFKLYISNRYAQLFAQNIQLTESKKQERLNNITLHKDYLYKRGRCQEKFPVRDVYFDEIKSVEYVDGTTEYVYDLTVETTRNFQLFNGINIVDEGVNNRRLPFLG